MTEDAYTRLPLNLRSCEGLDTITGPSKHAESSQSNRGRMATHSLPEVLHISAASSRRGPYSKQILSAQGSTDSRILIPLT